MKSAIATLFLATMVACSGSAAAQDSQVLSLKSRIALPNVKGRIDHFSVDVKGQRLFMAGVGNHTLEVIDLQSGKRVRTIPDLAEPQGVYYDATTNHLYVACGLDGVTNIYDGTSFALLGTVKFPDDADNIRYDARSKNVIVGYAGAKELRKREEGTGGLGFIDSTTRKQTRTIVIDAHPESFRLEENGTRLFVNVPDKQEIEVVDVVKGTILARWPVSAKNNFPMSLDEAHHRLFVGAWTPPRLIVFDTETGKEVASLELGEKGVVNKDVVGATDDLFYDSARGRVYVLNALGSIDVFQQKDPDHYDLVASIPTPPRTQTGLFVPELGKLFVGVIQQGKEDAEIRVYQAN
jgi:DNA-binding beta-propeller fold protein YncE